MDLGPQDRRSTTATESVTARANLPSPAGCPPNGRWSGYWHLLMARIRELQREPEIIFWIFVFPLLLALGLGIAFRNKPADLALVAIEAGPGAEQVLALIQDSPEKAAIRALVTGKAEAMRGFRLGKYDLIVVPGEGGGLQYEYDPSRPESMLARTQVDHAIQVSAGRKDPIATSSVTANEPGSRYIDFLVPGLLGMNIMNAAMWGIGFALVDMRQRKLLKRFVGTPMRKSDFLLALASSRLLLMVLEVGLLLGFGALVFHMRILGSLFSIILIGAVGAIAFGALGLLTASRAQKVESVSGLINLVMMPMWVFSGVFFSYQRFPAVLQPFIKALPLTALNDALRETILQGASLASQSGRLLVLAIWGTISFALALRWFRWT